MTRLRYALSAGRRGTNVSNCEFFLKVMALVLPGTGNSGTLHLDAPGTLPHVIFRGIERKPIVDDDKDRQLFVDRLEQLSIDLKTPIYAWSLMTNHVQILIRSGPGGLSSFMRKLLSGYAINYNRRHYRHGHLPEPI